MRLNIFLAAASIAALSAGAAAAQSATTDSQMSNPPVAPSANQAAAPAAATSTEITGPVASSPTPADQAYTLKAGDPNVVSNGPVPDTPENRAKYGAPLSNTGRHTSAAGN